MGNLVKVLTIMLCVTMSFAWAQENATCNIDTGMIRLTQTVPSKASVDQNYLCDIQLTATHNAAEIVVTTTLPANADYVKSEPNATQSGRSLVWKIDSMRSGENKELKVWVTAKDKGNIPICSRVKAVPYCCVNTFVGEAILAIDKSGPATAKLYDNVPYQIVVKNVGSTTAINVVSWDETQEGLLHATKSRKISTKLGNMQPGESRPYSTTYKAMRRGKHPSTAFAVADNTKQVEDSVETLVVLMDKRLEVKCPKHSYVGKRAQSTIVLSNPGDMKLTNVVVIASHSDKLVVTKAEGNPERQTNKLVWRVPSIEAGAQAAFDVEMISRAVGIYTLDVQATCCADPTPVKASCVTQWKGLPAMVVEMVDTIDPLLPGEETVYNLRITNQGSGDDSNVKVVINYPEEIKPLAVSGSTKGTINGQQVTFAPYPTFNPKETIQFSIKTKAVSIGNARIKALIYSELNQEPVNEEESTQVY